MKKLILTLLVAAITCSAFAQGNIQAAKDKLDKAVADLQKPKVAAKAASWVKVGNLYIDLADVNTGLFFPGMTAQQAILSLGKPLNAAAPEVVEINGVAYTKYQYPSVDAYFDGANVLKFFVETKPTMEDAFAKAEESLRKAYKLDPKSQEEVVKSLGRICTILIAKADNNYNLGNYDVAADSYYAAAVLGDDSLIALTGVPELLYYSVVANVAAGDLADALPAVDQMIAKNNMVEGDILYYKGAIEASLGNKAEAEAAYLRGVEEFPNNTKVLNNLIAFYIESGDDPKKVIPYIKAGQDADPTNAMLYMAEGIAYESMKDYANATKAYEKSIEINPNSFDALYNLGLAYYRMSSEVSKELEKISYEETEKYAEIGAKIDEIQNQSLEVLLKAHAIDPNEPNTIELIRSIYFRQRSKSDEMMAKYNEFDAKLKAIKGN